MMITKFWKILPIMVASLLPVFPCAHAAEEFEYGLRPASPIFDPLGLLKPEVVMEISKPLESIAQDKDIDIIVVVLADLQQAPPELVAGRFAKAWCKSPLHCVVLHVPGHADSPWIVPGGKLMAYLNSEQVREAVAAARRRAASEPKEEDKLKAASRESADLLRFWMASAKNYRAMIQAESAKMRLQLRDQSPQWRLALMMAGALLVSVAIAFILLVRLTAKRVPHTFPFYHWLPRLGAPYAGGNNIVADLGPPLP